MTTRPQHRTVGGLALLGGLLLLTLAGWAYLDRDRSVPPTPTREVTAWPTLLPDTPTIDVYQQVALLVTCNAPAELRLTDSAGREVATGRCRPNTPHQFVGLHAGPYVLHAYSEELEIRLEQELRLEPSEQEAAVLFPGLLEIAPVPTDATVDVDGHLYQGEASVTFPAEQCPVSTTVWVKAEGYTPYGTILVIKAGELYRQDVILAALPTPLPPPDVTARPTALPVTGAPTSAPWTVEERVELVRSKLYEKVNCWRAEAGLPALPYVSEWQALADEYARGWRDYYLQHGVEGFDGSAWRQQFQAAGGDGVTSGAGLVLYAPDYYVNMAPGSRWETFNMCEQSCPMYYYWTDRKADLSRASAVVIGLAPWWDGDVLHAAVIIGVKW